MLEDTARGRAYRWTADGPNYSAINLYPDSTANGLMYWRWKPLKRAPS
jgi:hypothetical protein